MPGEPRTGPFQSSVIITRANTTFCSGRAIQHDEIIYPDPYTFNPDRWIKDGKINTEIRDVTSGFGFGRR